MKTEILTREECSAMRGIAILGIMLHNYCHWLKDIVRENEYTWTAEKTAQLWELVQHPDALLPVHLLSFFGHYGVPVFLFLSGFGLVMKYEREGAADVSVWRFARYNYLKLFRMLVVGFVAFTMLDAVTPHMHRYHLTDVVGMLGMFSNLLEHPSQVIWPGPYWYFGLTLQLYLLYRLLLYRHRHWSLVVVLTLACWLLQEAALADRELLERLRYNFVGGMLPFAMGILLARCRQHPVFRWPLPPLLLLLPSALLVFFMSFSAQAWLWAPALVVVGTIGLVKALPAALLRPLLWLGGISAAVFVAHPLARKVFFRPYWHEDVYAGLLLYVVATLLLGWLFMKVIDRIPKPKL